MLLSYIFCFEQEVVLCPHCPSLDGTAADHKSGVIYSSGLFWRGQRKAINLAACCPSMGQHNNSKRELNGNRCHILNRNYFHSWDEDTASSSRVICPLSSPHADTDKHALKNAYTISNCVVGFFGGPSCTFHYSHPLWERETLLPYVSRPDSLAFPTSRWPVVFGRLKTGGNKEI